MFKINLINLILLILYCLEISFGNEVNLGDFLNEIQEKNQQNECGKHIENLDLWTRVQMIDASAKSIPSGILIGNFHDLGSYDECISIKSNVTEVRGKYCLLTLPLKTIAKFFPTKKKSDEEFLLAHFHGNNSNNNKKLKSLSRNSSLSGYHFGKCLPDKCTSLEISKLHPLLVADDDFCYTSQTKDMEIGSIIALVVIGGIALISIVSTTYDLIIFYFGGDPYHDLCLAFSMFSNGKKLLKTSNNPNQLLCLNGIKTFSMMWVVLGHNYADFATTAIIDNIFVSKQWLNSMMNMFIISGPLSVDTFFTLSGLLVVYTYMKTPVIELKRSITNIPVAYLHRYLRLSPALGVLILLYASGLIKYLGDGPRWGSLQDLFVDSCAKKWWATLLYIQNYMADSGMCVDQSWYLSVDMQLFLLTPFVLIPLKLWPKRVVPLMVVLIGVGIFIPFHYGYTNKFSGGITGGMNPAFADYYIKTHQRFSPYVIGMLAGYYIHKIKYGGQFFHLKKYQVLLIWVLTLVALLACIFDGHKFVNDEDNAWADGFYMGFNRSAWACAVCVMIILCVSGNGGPIDSFLSLPVFQILAKLSYSIYLVHYGILFMVNASSRGVAHFSNFDVILQFFGNSVIIVIVSVFYCLLFESPIVVLEKYIMPTRKEDSEIKKNVQV